MEFDESQIKGSTGFLLSCPTLTLNLTLILTLTLTLTLTLKP